MQAELAAHLALGVTTLCRAWKVTRRDGVLLGFTDHDGDLLFEDMTFVAQTGLTARALQQTTGMAVDNSEALGALSAASVREEDIAAGRFDDAEVVAYLVNWAEPEQRSILFRGNFGEITRARGAFRVELRGLTERLNLPTGRVYHANCAAQFGDAKCQMDLNAPHLRHEAVLRGVEQGRLRIALPEGFAADWFVAGRVQVLTGQAQGQVALIRGESRLAGELLIELWNGFALSPMPGDQIRLEAGCDKQASSCRAKFDNFLNFRGFPHIPGEDWLRINPSIAAGR